jgi:hypothetical protein
MRTIFIAGLAAALQFAAPSQAAVDLSFEDGTTNAWTLNGAGGASQSIGGFTAAYGDWFGFVVSGPVNVYQTLTQVVSLNAGQTLKGKVGFSTEDYMPYNDQGYFRINSTNLFTSSVSAVGAGGSTGWVNWSFVAPTTGNYTLQLGVRNRGDSSVNSYAVFDSSVVPEPGTWVMMIAGFAMVGLGARGRERGVAKVAN